MQQHSILGFLGWIVYYLLLLECSVRFPYHLSSLLYSSIFSCKLVSSKSSSITFKKSGMKSKSRRTPSNVSKNIFLINRTNLSIFDLSLSHLQSESMSKSSLTGYNKGDQSKQQGCISIIKRTCYFSLSFFYCFLFILQFRLYHKCSIQGCWHNGLQYGNRPISCKQHK